MVYTLTYGAQSLHFVYTRHLPPNVCPSRQPFAQKNEIEKIVQELLEAGVIYPSTSPYSSVVSMILKKEVN
jgi:hypothetical protein